MEDSFLTIITLDGREPERDRELIEGCLASNSALLDVREGLIQIPDFFDVLEFSGHDMDRTLAIFEENAEILGWL